MDKQRTLIDLDAEAKVLNTIITTPGLIFSIDNFIPEIFSSEFHQDICRAMNTIVSRNGYIDVLEIYKQNNNLTLAMLSAISGSGIFFSDLDGKVKYLYEMYMLRELLKMSNELAYMANRVNANPFTLNEMASNRLIELLPKNMSNSSNMADYFNEFRADLKESEAKGGAKGVMSGIRAIDEHTNGFKGGDMIVIAARPSVGKTALALKVITNTIFAQKENVGMFSLEMGKNQLMQRLIASEQDMPLSNMVNVKLTEMNWMDIDRFMSEKLGNPENGKLYVNDSSGIDIYGIRNCAKSFKIKYDIKLLVIDYLQLVSGSKKGSTQRTAEVSNISREIKIMAKELDIPVIALCQLNRSVDNRPDPKPILSDLKDSGSIEQDADIVAFMYREKGKTSNPIDEINFACEKHRQGHLFEEKIDFIKQTVKFTDHKGEIFTYNTQSVAKNDGMISSEKRNQNTDDLPF
ncbi:MAG: hypothetical protein KA284_12695 [Bacteroidia bacterium]|nr:hypothetical protein [Bacteroidia bacterium]